MEFYSPDLNLVTTIPQLYAPPRLSPQQLGARRPQGIFEAEPFWRLPLPMRGANGGCEAEAFAECGCEGGGALCLMPYAM